MRVLVLTSVYPPDIGGAPRVVEQFVQHLRTAGHQYEILTVRSETDALALDDGVHRIPSRTITARGLAASLWRSIGLVRAARRRGEPFDVVLCGVAYPCCLLAAVLRLLFRVRYVAYAHGEDVSIVAGGGRVLARLKQLATTWSLRWASTVFSNSRSTVGLLEEIGYPGERAVVLPPTIDVRPFLDVDPAATEALRDRLGLRGRRVLLTVARLSSPRKGHDIVVQAMAELTDRFPEVHYVIVGGGDQRTIRALADRVGVADRLTVLEQIDETDLAPLYALSELYVMPSRWDPGVREIEGFGIVYLEAAAAGLAAVGGNVGGAVESIVDGVTGLTVDPSSPATVAEAIACLLADPARAAEMGTAGRRRVVDGFTNEHVMPRLDTALRAAARVR